MEFLEVKKDPEFTLVLSLDDAISLWHIVNESLKNGNVKAENFVNAMYDFAKNSNSY